MGGCTYFTSPPPSDSEDDKDDATVEVDETQITVIDQLNKEVRKRGTVNISNREAKISFTFLRIFDLLSESSKMIITITVTIIYIFSLRFPPSFVDSDPRQSSNCTCPLCPIDGLPHSILPPSVDPMENRHLISRKRRFVANLLALFLFEFILTL